MDDLFVTGYSSIKNGIAAVAGEVVFKNDSYNPSVFLKELYLFLGTDYPKFYKMDTQSQLGIMAAQLMFNKQSFSENYKEESMGIVLSNAAASEDTDRKYLTTLDKADYFPSPSLFVYTLPNIAGGELCIRYKIKGENNFFITETFDADLLCQNIAYLMKYTTTNACISGWVNCNKEKLDAFLFIVEKVQGSYNLPLKPEVLNELYFN